ncbi:MAG: CocE/NonD family hydrolase [Alphaproteobacteria bacterium]|nr:MAG: CocE/NonD family hydrolase [Alphaproteobacteria bacterium]
MAMAKSAPYQVVLDANVMVAMRDGVRLATDIYHPALNGKPIDAPLPVVLERTPYDKAGIGRSEITARDAVPATRHAIAHFFASHGYVVVFQDVRGRFASEGQFSKYVNEGPDGFDTAAWIVAQPWCDGRIATMGLSYGAHTQTAMASAGAPGIAAMLLDSGGFSNAYESGIRQGGAFELKQATWAHRHAIIAAQTAGDVAAQAKLQAEDLAAWFRDMPWRPGHSPLRASPDYEAYLFEQWHHGLFDDYWRRAGLYTKPHYHRFPKVPICILCGWYDPYAKTSIDNFLGLSGRGTPTYLVMGPWTHGARSLSYAGEVDFGTAALFDGNIAADYHSFRLAWLDHCLKGEGPPPLAAPVTYFMMGGGTGAKTKTGRRDHGGTWRRSPCWPPADARPSVLYLHADGRLTPQASDAEEAFAAFISDPDHPVPTIGGAITSGLPIMEGGAFDQTERAQFFGADGSGRPLAARPDVLSFQTPPLDADFALAGTLTAKLWVGSDCPDIDIALKLIDVAPATADYPDGFAMNLSHGILRLRYRKGWDREVFMQPDAIYEITVEMFPTANLFKRGHRLRIDIAGSNYPHFDINPNSGEPEGNWSRPVVAHNRLWLDRRRPSRLIVPSIKTGPS